MVVACGNGTAGAFAPEIIARLGAEVIPLHTALDHSFPNYNPNPEDMHMLHDIAAAVLANGADVGLGFDGDGDRCGVVDNEGNEIFSDKVGLMLARDLSKTYPMPASSLTSSRHVYTNRTLFYTLQVPHGVLQDRSFLYKATSEGTLRTCRIREVGTFLFQQSIGRGYDDGMVTAIAVLDMLSRKSGESLAELYRALPRTWGSPTMSADCADEVKYQVVARFTQQVLEMKAANETIGGHSITSVNTVNGARVATHDGTWGLVRASSNKAELVVVIESPVSKARLYEMFRAVDGLLRQSPEVGDYIRSYDFLTH